MQFVTFQSRDWQFIGTETESETAVFTQKTAETFNKQIFVNNNNAICMPDNREHYIYWAFGHFVAVKANQNFSSF